MSLRDQAVSDVTAILKNTSDFGQEDIILTDPAGDTTDLVGFTGDISTTIDPDSGAIVKGRQLHVTIPINDLPAGPRPEAIRLRGSKPWLVSFPRITSAAVTQYVVIGSDPDDSMGAITLELGKYSV